ncbi:RIP metalloprotease RseP [Aliigemmobacter aestuarii]|uniref:Zinc metalloprotease n=1 Tax=Aliigemmobacter aestuarii TaxID=1445661 RepID=A0A4S3MT75_9RHOB|nr:RIP metalloprotease RseP [Gemmobacter aestuarii]THD85806.1 RIP metalloprotease RseP [Gemmobacter aestuarii]
MDFSTIFSTLGGGLWTIAFFIIALSIIVFIHEYGHYIVGRWSGIHAEVFSIGFGPVLVARTDRCGTKWQIAAIPFGGYVKFMGDANAASGVDGDAMAGLSAEERRHTMHGAPLWARAATVAAGPIFNFLLTIAVFLGFLWTMGIATDEPVVGKLKPTPYVGETIRPGDRIIALAGQPTPDFEAFSTAMDGLPAVPEVDYRVIRNGQEIDLKGPHPLPPLVGQVHPLSAAGDAGLKAGDVILAVDGRAVATFAELPAIVEATGDKPLTLTIWREGAQEDVTLTPRRRDLPKAEGGFETRWLIGLTGGLVFEPATRTPGPVEAMRLALTQTWDLAVTSMSGLWHIVTGAISTCNISGPIGMADMMGEAARGGVEEFFTRLAVLSLGIGILNLFPIPVLDGGHLVFHAYEAVTGRPPSERAMRILMTAGLALLLSFMLFAISNDLFCT